MSFRSGNSRAAKVTPMEVLDMREKYAAGRSQGSLAREYGMSVGQIGRIVRGESWQQYGMIPTDHDVRIRTTLEQQALKTVNMTPEMEASAEALKLRLKGQEERADPFAAKPKPPSLYNDPPPTLVEDTAISERTHRRLDLTKIEKPTDVKDELDKLKGD